MFLNLLLLDQREQVDTDKSSSAQSFSASEDTYPHLGNPGVELVGSIFQSVSTVPTEIPEIPDTGERSSFHCAGMPLVSQIFSLFPFLSISCFAKDIHHQTCLYIVTWCHFLPCCGAMQKDNYASVSAVLM